MRNNDDLRPPHARTVGFRRSFYPSAIRLGNQLNDQVKNSPSLPTFKRLLKSGLFPTRNKLHSYGIGRAPVQLARMRMCLSALNQHRHKYHYIPSPACESCGNRIEDVTHFMLYCPTYQGARNSLILSIAPLVINISPDIETIRNNRHAQAVVNILLSGDNRLSTETNQSILSHVFTYIASTNRFR